MKARRSSRACRLDLLDLQNSTPPTPRDLLSLGDMDQESRHRHGRPGATKLFYSRHTPVTLRMWLMAKKSFPQVTGQAATATVSAKRRAACPPFYSFPTYNRQTRTQVTNPSPTSFTFLVLPSSTCFELLTQVLMADGSRLMAVLNGKAVAVIHNIHQHALTERGASRS